jgi:hypothetical protein
MKMDNKNQTQTSVQAPTETVKLEVRSKSDKGFNRAGYHFSPEPVEIDVDVEKAQRIVDEPQLFVRQLGGPTITPTDPDRHGLFRDRGSLVSQPATPAPVNVTPQPTLTTEPTPNAPRTEPEAGGRPPRGR